MFLDGPVYALKCGVIPIVVEGRDLVRSSGELVSRVLMQTPWVRQPQNHPVRQLERLGSPCSLFNRTAFLTISVSAAGRCPLRCAA